VKPSNLWNAQLAEAAGAKTSPAPAADAIDLSRGRLTAEQIDLLLEKLPMDITIVDENAQVWYYSDTKDLIFPSIRPVIGRQAQNCHPPKSLNTVNAVVQAFRDNTKDRAEF